MFVGYETDNKIKNNKINKIFVSENSSGNQTI